MKLFRNSYIKSVNVEDRTVFGAVASTGAVDRHGESLNPKGWLTSNFMRNPVILLNHDYEGLPIGKAINVYEKNGELLIDFKIAQTALGNEILELIDGGFLNALSVGFIPTKFDEMGDYFWAEMELLEVSVVTVPANAEALIKVKSLNEELHADDNEKHFDLLKKLNELLEKEVTNESEVDEDAEVTESETDKSGEADDDTDADEATEEETNDTDDTADDSNDTDSDDGNDSDDDVEESEEETAETDENAEETEDAEKVDTTTNNEATEDATSEDSEKDDTEHLEEDDENDEEGEKGIDTVDVVRKLVEMQKKMRASYTEGGEMLKEVKGLLKLLESNKVTK